MVSERDPAAVRTMFDRIARRYDLVNTVLSLGTDGGWRRRAARETGLKAGGSALDVACGSGKLTAELARVAGPSGPVVGLDFSPEMLAIARLHHPGIEFMEGDALNLPFEDSSFDATTIARMLGDFQRVLECLIGGPEQPLSTFRSLVGDRSRGAGAPPRGSGRARRSR